LGGHWPSGNLKKCITSSSRTLPVFWEGRREGLQEGGEGRIGGEGLEGLRGSARGSLSKKLLRTKKSYTTLRTEAYTRE